MTSLGLAPGVALLNPAETVLAGMLLDWRNQQIGGRNLTRRYVKTSAALVQRFVDFSDAYPWEWTAAGFDKWMTTLVEERELAPTTIRLYQSAIRQFCEFICSPHYEWPEKCVELFGERPRQICHEGNTARHLQDYEGGSRRRPLTPDELQLLFDFADAQVEECVTSGRKGAAVAFRNSTLLKVAYAWGLRANEAVSLELTDFFYNPDAPELGRYGTLHVRNGKGSRGSGPKRRPVVSLFPWAIEAVDVYVKNIWPGMRMADSNALWVSERGTRMRPRELSECFAKYRDAVGLDRKLTLHCLRNSYGTQLQEFGTDHHFIQRMMGHRFASTTSLYISVGGDFMRKTFRAALDEITERPPT